MLNGQRPLPLIHQIGGNPVSVVAILTPWHSGLAANCPINSCSKSISGPSILASPPAQCSIRLPSRTTIGSMFLRTGCVSIGARKMITVTTLSSITRANPRTARTRILPSVIYGPFGCSGVSFYQPRQRAIGVHERFGPTSNALARHLGASMGGAIWGESRTLDACRPARQGRQPVGTAPPPANESLDPPHCGRAARHDVPFRPRGK